MSRSRSELIFGDIRATCARAQPKWCRSPSGVPLGNFKGGRKIYYGAHRGSRPPRASCRAMKMPTTGDVIDVTSGLFGLVLRMPMRRVIAGRSGLTMMREPFGGGKNAASRRRHLIIDADGAGGLGNREGNGRGPAEQERRPARDRAPTSGRRYRRVTAADMAPATRRLDAHHGGHNKTFHCSSPC